MVADEFTPEDLGRFRAKVVHAGPDACWEWTGARSTAGYGYCWFGGKTQSAHRVAYLIARGPIPAGLHIDHLCRNRGCVNPAHMEAVEPGENTRRGMSPGAVSVRMNRCRRGHEFTPENTYTTPGGQRMCRECCRARDRERRKRQGPRTKANGWINGKRSVRGERGELGQTVIEIWEVAA